jgi:tRNA pseudouridine38-40 synthase
MNHSSIERRLRFDIAYNGTHYYGWQIQKKHNNHPTIQEEIEKNLSILLNEPCQIFGAGRTDSGVHAEGQVAHLSTTSTKSCEILHRGLNRRLPNDIHIKKVSEVEPSFHARFSAKGKHYQYRLWIAPEKPLFHFPFVSWYACKPDLKAMRNAAQKLLGQHDFTSFATNADRPNEIKIREIWDISIREEYPFLFFDVKGRSFLYKMVRGLCGTLLHVGLNPTLDVEKILHAKDRTQAKRNLPASGLFLMEVYY